MAEQIIFGPVRLAFVNLLEAKEGPNGEKAKYSTKCIFEKNADTSSLKRIMAAAAKKKWGDDIPKGLRNPIRDGDEVTWSGFADHDFITASLNPDFGRPGVVDKNLNPIINREDLYPGCWAYVKISAYAYDSTGNKGVSFNVHHVMKSGDDERLDGGESAEMAFKDFKPVVSEADNAGSNEDSIFG